MLQGRALIATAFILGCAAPAAAQMDDATRSAKPSDKMDCSTYFGSERSKCTAEQKATAKRAASSSGGVNAKDAKLINDSNAAAQAKIDAGDIAGAAAVYQAAIAGAEKNPVRHHLYLGLALTQRRQGVAAFNAGAKPEYPPPFSSNEVIRAANAKNAALQAQKIAAAMPLITTALETATQAATLADAATDKTADPAIGVEMREDAGLLYRLDRAAVLATPRPSAELEATWLRRWLTGTAPVSPADAAKYGVPVAAALAAKDPAAGLTLADEVQAKTGTDIDGALGYAEIVAAKAPAGDPHRAKALAGLTAVEASVTDGQQKAQLTKLKTTLAVKS